MPSSNNPLGRGSQTGRPLLSLFFGVVALVAGVVYPLTNGDPETSRLLIAWVVGIVLGLLLAFVPGIVAIVMLIVTFTAGQFLARTLLGDAGYGSPAGLFMIGAASLAFAVKDGRAGKAASSDPGTAAGKRA